MPRERPLGARQVVGMKMTVKQRDVYSCSQLSQLRMQSRAKPYLLTDGNYPYLMMTLQGNKLWRLRYRSAGTLVT